MDKKTETKISKFMSLVLRHDPAVAGLELDEQGWVGVDLLIQGLKNQGFKIELENVLHVVRNNPKQRFILSDDSLQIRANQGHSIDVDLGYESAIPPQTLYHGTYEDVLEVIESEGLKKMQRHHVHLSEKIESAREVGARRGRPVILTIDAGRMHADGHIFMVTPNRVWLVDTVPAQYLGALKEP